MVFAAIKATIPREILLTLHNAKTIFRIIDIAAEIYPAEPEIVLPEIAYEKPGRCIFPYCCETPKCTSKTSSKGTVKISRTSLFCDNHHKIYCSPEGIIAPNLAPLMRYVLPFVINPDKYIIIYELDPTAIPELEAKFKGEKATIVKSKVIEENPEFATNRCWAECRLNNSKDEFMGYAPAEEVFLWEFLKANSNPADMVKKCEDVEDLVADITNRITSLEVIESESDNSDSD